MPAEKPTHFMILTPVFNDWKAAGMLLQKLDQVLQNHGMSASVLLLDDGSTLPFDKTTIQASYKALEQIDILEMRRNLGHQRAICIGLCHLESQGLKNPLVIMDSDGEDSPEDIPRLWEQYQADQGKNVIFAARARRSEGILFRLGYHSFRLLHLLLTGRAVRVGNFSMVPPAAVSKLVTSSDLWSHYAASVFHTRIPWSSVPTQRAQRLDGTSHMNLVALVVHGLAAISVFSDHVGARLLLVCILLATVAAAGILGVVFVKFFTPLAIPGWATNSTGLLALMLLQAGLLAAFFSFLILNGRNRADFLPSRDFTHFLGGRKQLFPGVGNTDPSP